VHRSFLALVFLLDWMCFNFVLLFFQANKIDEDDEDDAAISNVHLQHVC